MKFDPTRPMIKRPTGYWNAHHDDLKVMLGLPKKLPKEGVPPQVIQGIKVWVEPHVPKTWVQPWTGKTLAKKSSKHRVMAECPLCGMHLSAGRLHQHKCSTVTLDTAPAAGTPVNLP